MSNQELDMMPDELDMFIATHTSVSDDTDDGVYREAEYHALKKALANLVKKHGLRARIDTAHNFFPQVNVETGRHEVWFKGFNASGQEVAGNKEAYINMLKQELEKL